MLIRRGASLVLDFGLYVSNGVALNIECDDLSGESLNEDLHIITADLMYAVLKPALSKPQVRQLHLPL
jgi:hypothetical protein